MPQISLIVPVYCAENTLAPCVESVLQQTWQDFELLLIDDGSTDKSGQMCDVWAKKDARIRVIHKENGGVQTAVLRGIAEITAPFCAFMDSDDMLKPEMLEKLMEAMLRTQSEMVCCGYATMCGTQETVTWAHADEQIFNHTEIQAQLRKFYEETGELTHLCEASRCNKLYCTSLLRNVVQFLNPAQTLGEDMVLNLYALERCNRLTRIPYVGYLYRARENSATRSMSNQKLQQYQLMLQELHKTAAIQGYGEALGLKMRKDKLFSILLLQTLMSTIATREKIQVLHGLRSEISDKGVIRRFASTQPMHGKICLQLVAAGAIASVAVASTMLQAVRARVGSRAIT